jgi:DNA-directed RNA polymerase specialized sigma24 family protein
MTKVCSSRCLSTDDWALFCCEMYRLHGKGLLDLAALTRPKLEAMQAMEEVCRIVEILWEERKFFPCLCKWGLWLILDSVSFRMVEKQFFFLCDDDPCFLQDIIATKKNISETRRRVIEMVYCQRLPLEWAASQAGVAPEKALAYCREAPTRVIADQEYVQDTQLGMPTAFREEAERGLKDRMEVLRCVYGSRKVERALELVGARYAAVIRRKEEGYFSSKSDSSLLYEAISWLTILLAGNGCVLNSRPSFFRALSRHSRSSVAAAITSLTKNQQNVFIPYYNEGMSVPEIVARNGSATKSVESALRKARLQVLLDLSRPTTSAGALESFQKSVSTASRELKRSTFAQARPHVHCALYLRYVEELEQAEVAQRMKASVSTVRGYLKEGARLFPVF